MRASRGQEQEGVLQTSLDKAQDRVALLVRGALDGASLTVVDVDREERTFSVWLIPETLRITRFGEKQPGDFINVELDPQTVAIVETVERVMKARLDA